MAGSSRRFCEAGLCAGMDAAVELLRALGQVKAIFNLGAGWIGA
jgi:hypothetical protein